MRIATALLLWRNEPWSKIEGYLDDYFKFVAKEVLKNEHSPVIRIEDGLFTKRWAKIRLTGQTTKQFSEGEKQDILRFLQGISKIRKHDGHISSQSARQLIGLSDSASEMTQLARLFREWEKEGIMTKIKKGHWKFN